MFYYHIPGVTGYNIKIYDLLTAAITEGKFPNLMGVKFVSNDNSDWFKSLERFGDQIKLLYAPEPKLQVFICFFIAKRIDLCTQKRCETFSRNCLLPLHASSFLNNIRSRTVP